MQSGYHAIANSIASLTMQQRVRSVSQINEAIIAACERKVTLQNAGANVAVINAFFMLVAIGGCSGGGGGLAAARRLAICG